jgi:hypothetical protein
MHESAEQLVRQRLWGIAGADVVTGETLMACVAEANGIARWLGLRVDIVIPAPEVEVPRAAAAPARDASAPACPAA